MHMSALSKVELTSTTNKALRIAYCQIISSIEMYCSSVNIQLFVTPTSMLSYSINA